MSIDEAIEVLKKLKIYLIKNTFPYLENTQAIKIAIGALEMQKNLSDNVEK